MHRLFLLLPTAFLHVVVVLPAAALSEFELRLEAHDLSPAPAGPITSPATTLTTYQYDDDSFEEAAVLSYASGEVAWENELAQRFTLTEPGSLKWAEVCLGNSASLDQSFDFVVYVKNDSGGLPGSTIARATSNTESLPTSTYSCYRIAVREIRVGALPLWVSVEWTPAGDDTPIVLMGDDSNSRGRRAFRAKASAGNPYSDWRASTADWVYGIRLGVEHTTSDPDPEPPPPPTGGATLHDGTFSLSFVATANNRNHNGTVADWSSSKGVLFWVFDDENPEALMKVLDGRLTNGSWWMDVAVTSDLLTTTNIRHETTGATWGFQTGRASNFGITDPDIANELVHCAAPLDRSDQQCAIVGIGTTVSLRDAWDLQGRIPNKYYVSTSQSATAATFGLFRAQRPDVTASGGDSTPAVP